MAGRLAVLLGLSMTAGLLLLHVEYYRHAGALWRDEVNSINVAGAPSFPAVWAKSALDSFPVAWVTVLHAWMAAGMDGTDADLRRLGLLIGAALIAAVWWSGRRLGLAAPLVTLLLLCLSPTAIIYGDEVRGYGLAALTIVWCIGALWSFLERRSAGAFLIAQIAAVAAVQAYYANCFLLLAIGAAAAAVTWVGREWRILAATLAIGAVAAASMLVDVSGLTYAARVAPIEQGAWSLTWLAGVFREALAPDVPLLQAVWIPGAAAAAVGIALALRAPATPADRARALYAGIGVGLSIVTYFFCLKFVARLPTQYWYYLSFIAVLALGCDVGIDLLARRFAIGPAVRIGAVAAAALAAAPSVARVVPMRMTNVDVIAATLQKTAEPRDLVVVVPWVNGISFARYYRGAAPWITLPDLDDHRFHAHLAVAERMRLGDAGVRAELERVEQTLRAGGKVWLVGAPPALPPGTAPPSLPPAPSGPTGWQAAPYLDAWEAQLGTLLRTRGANTWQIALPDTGPVNAWESPPLLVVEGWH